MEIRVGDLVKIRRTMHSIRGGKQNNYDMFRSGVVLRFTGTCSAIVRVNMKQLANGEWTTQEMVCKLRVLSKMEAVSA